MVAQLVAAVAGELKNAFGNSYAIYQNRVEQGLKRPCFFILTRKIEKKTLLGTRFLMRYPMTVLFMPETEGDNAAMLAIAEILERQLAFINLEQGDRLRAGDMKWEIRDGVLEFYVNYSAVFVETQEKDVMEKMAASIFMAGETR